MILSNTTRGHYRKTLDAIDQIQFDIVEDEVGIRYPAPNGQRYPLGATLVRVSYSGTETLSNVVIATRTEMKPISAESEAARAEIGLLNSIFGPGGERYQAQVNAADDYIKVSQLLHATQQASHAFLRELQPGDVVYVPLYSIGFRNSLKEAKVSFYSEQGGILDNIVEQEQPESTPTKKVSKRRPTRPEVSSKLPRYKNTQITHRLELQLKSTELMEESISCNQCVPVGDSFVSINRQIEVKVSTPVNAIASCSNWYVVEVPAQTSGWNLVLIPSSAVKKRKMIDERTDEQKALDEEIKQQNNRNRSRRKLR